MRVDRKEMAKEGLSDAVAEVIEDSNSINAPAFIRVAKPPAFDVERHLPFIRTQLPAEQMGNLDAALKANPSLFDSTNRNDLIIDCSAEESFTLETFGGHLKAARSAGKDFILARVTTLDPSGPKPHLYHSHYSAHHLNKILFRTQPEEGLLHRMKSRNPLNNMLIVGDVDYFVITPADYDAAVRRFGRLVKFAEGESDADKDMESIDQPNEIPTMTEVSSSSNNDTGAANNGGSLFSFLQRKSSNGSVLTDDGKPIATGSPQINVAPFENAKDFTSPNQSVMDLTAFHPGRNASNTSLLQRSSSLNELPNDGEPAILYEAHCFATDDDFLMRSEIREYFKANSVNSDDYLLFTLYRNAPGSNMTEIPITGFTSISVPAQEADGQNGSEQRVKSWKNVWGFFYTPSPSISTLRTGVISRTAFKYVLALYIVACVLALVFFIPIELSYFIGFGMFVLILFVTIFFVECNPRESDRRWNLFTYRQRMQQNRENAHADANITSSQTIGGNPSAATSRTALNQV